MSQTAYCPDCKAEIPPERLKFPIFGCPRCQRPITYPSFTPPPPKVFERFDKAARQASSALLRAWECGDERRKAEVEGKLKALITLLETA